MFKGFVSFATISVITTISLVGCAPQEKRNQTIPASRLAAENIQSSFLITTDTPVSTTTAKTVGASPSEDQFGEVNGSVITLKKSALGKSFLLTPVLLTATNSPIPQHLLPKVVSFELHGEDLALFELNSYALYDELSSTKLLQTFQIASQDAEKLTFKWTYGLSAIPLRGTLGVSDMPQTLLDMMSEQETVLPTVSSFLKKATFVGNRLELEQISRVRTGQLQASLFALLGGSPLPVNDQDVTVQLNTTITPYRPNPKFALRSSVLDKGIGFFEIAQTRKNDGGVDVYASRWDLSPESGPVTYAITKNAPAELTDSIKEGVLYWNKVFGREVVRVETGADSHESPTPRRVLIYWIPWKQAGFALASLQPDPITGELKNAAVFLTSAFDTIGRVRARQALPRNTQALESALGLAPSGFRSGLLCGFSDDNHLSTFNELANQGSDDPKIVLKAAQDYVRLVVSHEVGHTLGLRHNFAGSIASELPSANEHLSKWKEYLGDLNHHGSAISSTVMDYLNGRDSFLLGAAIHEKPLAYDQAATTWGYSEKPVEVKDLKVPLFCTDVERAMTITQGCAAFDSGRNPIAGWAQDLSLGRENVAQRILDDLITAIHPENQSDKKSVKEAAVSEDPKILSAILTAPAVQIFKNLSNTAKSLIVDRQLEGSNWLNEKVYKQQNQQALSQSIEEANGLPGLLQTAYGIDSSLKIQKGWLVKAITDKVNDPSFGKGKTLSGIAYELTNDEISDIKTYAPQIAAKLENTFLRDLLLSVTGGDPISVIMNSGGILSKLMKLLGGGADQTYMDNVARDAWQLALGQLAEQIILDTDGTLNGMVDDKSVMVPAPKYPADVRLAAVRLLADKTFKKEGWLTDVQTKVTDAVKQRALLVAKDSAITPSPIPFPIPGMSDLPTIKGKKLTPDLKEWAQDELAILKALKDVDSDGSDILNKLMGGSMLGIRWSDLGIGLE